jgi:hypothetical protein
MSGTATRVRFATVSVPSGGYVSLQGDFITIDVQPSATASVTASSFFATISGTLTADLRDSYIVSINDGADVTLRAQNAGFAKEITQTGGQASISVDGLPITQLGGTLTLAGTSAVCSVTGGESVRAVPPYLSKG